MPPIDHTNGMTAYALAARSQQKSIIQRLRLLTFVSRIRNQLADHRLNDTLVSIQCAAQEPSEQRHPKVKREADNEQRDNGTTASHHQDRLSAQSVTQPSPEPATRQQKFSHANNGNDRTTHIPDNDSAREKDEMSTPA